MKATINITGQTGSINSLFNKMPFYYSNKVDNGRFGSKTIHFNSKKEAIQVLAEARQRMQEEGMTDDFNYSYVRGESLSYDAATARITTEN